MDDTTLLLNLLVDGLVTGCIYALVAIGFSLVWWICDIIHLAHGGVLLVAGYVIYVVAEALGLPLPAALLCGLAAAAVLGLFIDSSIYRPLQQRQTGELGMITASLGVLIILEFALTIAFGPEGVSAHAGKIRHPLWSPAVPAFDGYAMLAIGSTLTIFALLALGTNRTRLGKEMRAIAENRQLGRVLGIDSRVVQRTTALIAAALVVPPAAFYLYNTGATPHEALHLVLIAAVAAIIGGRGSISGALLAGIVMGIAESVMVWHFAAGWRLLVVFAFLYVLLLVRPQGLFGKA